MAERSEILARRRVLQQRAGARREVRLFARRLSIVLFALIMLLVVGSVGFSLIEGSSLGYGFDWTVDTLTTVGSIPEPRDCVPFCRSPKSVSVQVARACAVPIVRSARTGQAQENRLACIGG